MDTQRELERMRKMVSVAAVKLQYSDERTSVTSAKTLRKILTDLITTKTFKILESDWM